MQPNEAQLAQCAPTGGTGTQKWEEVGFWSLGVSLELHDK